MRKSKIKGFDYYLSKEAIESYREKPIELRLKWLYMGNLLRKKYSKKVIRLQDKFREGK
ncbi:MAG: hypothetical protein HY026_01260 [Deltaproteobacteria bacterium]|nr:hypothetical protein [Deltaproteobacteria bacterium]